MSKPGDRYRMWHKANNAFTDVERFEFNSYYAELYTAADDVRDIARHCSMAAEGGPSEKLLVAINELMIVIGTIPHFTGGKHK